MDCRDIERSTVLNTLKNAAAVAANVNAGGHHSAPPVSLLIRRRRIGRRYTATLHLWDGKDSSNSQHHGLTLDLGVYITRIQPGSAAAKEGNIAVGDRIISINNHPLDHIQNIAEAVQVLNKCAIQNENSSNKQGVFLTLTLAKSTNGLSMIQGGYGGIGSGNTIGGDRALSSSSSGHNLPSGLSGGDLRRSGMLDEKDLNQQLQMMASQSTQGSSIHPYPEYSLSQPSATSPAYSPTKSSITSPIKESIQRGSQEFKRLLGAGASSSSNQSAQHIAKHPNPDNNDRFVATTLPSSSIEQLQHSNQSNAHSSGIKSPFGSGTGSQSLIETVKEKIDNVRHGRKKGKESSTQAKPDSTQSPINQDTLSHQLAEFTLDAKKDVRLQDYMHHSSEGAQKPNELETFVNKEHPTATEFDNRKAVNDPKSPTIEDDIMVSNGEDLALAELDSVINSYHSSSSGGGAKSNGEKAKRSKRNKEGHSRGGGAGGSAADSMSGNSFKSGGTWPRTRGGPIIDHGTGTILHPQKHKKERLPLKELLSNVPNYPPETSPQAAKQKTERQEKHSSGHPSHNISAPAKVVHRNDDALSRDNRVDGGLDSLQPASTAIRGGEGNGASNSRKVRPLTTYDMLHNSSAAYGVVQKLPEHEQRYVNLDLIKSSLGSSDSRDSSNRKTSVREQAVIAPLNPTSIDNSVKSAAAGKDIIERYLKKSKTSTSPQHPMLGVEGGHLYPELAQMAQNHHHQQTVSSAALAQQQMQNLVRPNASNSFSPYYSPTHAHQQPHPHLNSAQLMSSSPRISSPPPPGIGSLGDSVLLGSPIHQQQLHEYRSGSALPSNASSAVAGLDSLTSLAGRGATVNYNTSYVEGSHQIGMGSNLPLHLQSHHLRHGRNNETRNNEIRASSHVGGSTSHQYNTPNMDQYALSLSSMSTATGVYQQGPSVSTTGTGHSGQHTNMIHDLIGPSSSATSSLGSIITTSASILASATSIAHVSGAGPPVNSATISHSPSPSTLESYIQQLSAATNAGNRYLRSTTPSSLIQASGLPQPPSSSSLYHHAALSPSSGGLSTSSIVPPSSTGMPTSSNIQPPYTIGGGTHSHQQQSYSPSMGGMISSGTGSGYMVPSYLTHMGTGNISASNSIPHGMSGSNHSQQQRVSFDHYVSLFQTSLFHTIANHRLKTNFKFCI